MAKNLFRILLKIGFLTPLPTVSSLESLALPWILNLEMGEGVDLSNLDFLPTLNARIVVRVGFATALFLFCCLLDFGWRHFLSLRTFDKGYYMTNMKVINNNVIHMMEGQMKTNQELHGAFFHLISGWAVQFLGPL